MHLIQPALTDSRLLEDIRHARTDAGTLHVWWLGQSGFLVLWEGRCLLLDPYLSDSLTRKYAHTDKPHVRISERVIAPGALDFVHVVSSSHAHTDHLDPDTLRPLVDANPGLEIACPEANRALVRQRTGLPDERIHGLDVPDGENGRVVPGKVTLAGFEFLAVPAAHETRETDDQGRSIYLGWIIRAGPWVIYHSGDTVLYPGMVDQLKHFAIDLALLPINGRSPERRVAGNLTGREAAQLARAIGAGCVIPCHYDLFAFNTASPAEFEATCRILGQHHVVLPLGGRWSGAKTG